MVFRAFLKFLYCIISIHQSYFGKHISYSLIMYLLKSHEISSSLAYHLSHLFHGRNTQCNKEKKIFICLTLIKRIPKGIKMKEVKALDKHQKSKVFKLLKLRQKTRRICRTESLRKKQNKTKNKCLVEQLRDER